MVKEFVICVATEGQGVFQSPDGGESWNRIRSPFPLESRVGALKVSTENPNLVYAGTDSGIYRSEDQGLTWERLSPLPEGYRAFSMEIDKRDPQVMFVGTTPPALFRSRNGGIDWQRLTVDIAQECAIGTPRVTAIAVDPLDHQTVWAGVEIDGVYKSLDGGDTWTHIDGGLSDPDIHDVVIRSGKTSEVLVGTPQRIFTSDDRGATWHTLVASEGFPLGYCRAVAVKEGDPSVIFVASGDSAIGDSGGIQRTRDGGNTWESLALPDEPNSPIWSFATHASDPDLILATSHFGEIYVTADGGDSWRKVKREFSEIPDVVWTPKSSI